MPHKNPGRAHSEPGRESLPNEQNLQSAYQIHTLAQIMYGQLYGAQPWTGPNPMATQSWMPPAQPVAPAWGAVPPAGFHGLPYQPVQWPPFHAYPFGWGWGR